MTPRTPLFLLIPLLLLAACNDVPTTSSNLFPYPKTGDQLVPLAIGNTWVYRNMLTGEIGTPTAPYFISEITGFGEYKGWIPNPKTGEIDHSEDCILLELPYFTHGTAAYGVTFGGILFGTLETEGVMVRRSLPQNPVVGGTYSYDKSLMCTAVEQVTVPAGTFQCYRFTLNGPRKLYWWSRGTGLIQHKAFGDQGELVEHWGLDSYTLR